MGELTAAVADVIAREFFDRPATEVAPDLLGCVLEHHTGDGLVAVELTEVEAYMGAADPASHAYRGRTERNAVMFGPPGHAYVYFTYGMHFCVNLVCLPPGTASAVLLRAGRVVAGEDLARARRPAASRPASLASGPARLTQVLGIDRRHNGTDVCDAASKLLVRGTRRRYEGITTGPRVGVNAGADIAWRFWVSGDPSVSAYRAHVPRRRVAVSGGNELPCRAAEVALLQA